MRSRPPNAGHALQQVTWATFLALWTEYLLLLMVLL